MCNLSEKIQILLFLVEKSGRIWYPIDRPLGNLQGREGNGRFILRKRLRKLCPQGVAELFRVPVRTWPNLGYRVRIGKVLPAKRA